MDEYARIKRVNDRLAAALVGRHPNVVGCGIGKTADGRWCIRLYLASEGRSGLPTDVDGFPVEAEVTGPVRFAAQSTSPDVSDSGR